jgi:hypothetical protein
MSKPYPDLAQMKPENVPETRNMGSFQLPTRMAEHPDIETTRRRSYLDPFDQCRQPTSAVEDARDLRELHRR